MYFPLPCLITSDVSHFSTFYQWQSIDNSHFLWPGGAQNCQRVCRWEMPGKRKTVEKPSITHMNGYTMVITNAWCVHMYIIVYIYNIHQYIHSYSTYVYMYISYSVCIYIYIYENSMMGTWCIWVVLWYIIPVVSMILWVASWLRGTSPDCAVLLPCRGLVRLCGQG